MVYTRRGAAELDAEEERQLQKCLKTSLSEISHQTPQRIRKPKQKTASTRRINKDPKPNRNPTTPSKSVKIKSDRLSHRVKLCRVKYQKISYEILSCWNAAGKIKSPLRPKTYWPYPNHPGIKLGHNSWEHLNWKGPSEEQVRHLNAVLDERHAEFEHKSYVDMPAHAVRSALNVDVCIQTIFAQSTGNEIAIDTHCRLRNAFTYEKNGKRFAGKIPNWHTIRCLEQEDLERHLRQGGFYMNRARKIKELLDMVYATNLKRQRDGVQMFEHSGNPPNAVDFVPGLLSLDFLLDNKDNSDEAILGRLLDLPQIGLKSAMCLMAFAMKRECFPVDTHVLRMCKWLGWLPKDCNDPKKAAMFMAKHIPGPIMFNLHQVIWTHCANENVRMFEKRVVICHVCGAGPPAKGVDIEKALRDCPLTDLLPPLGERWGTRYKLSEVRVESPVTNTPEIEDQYVENLKIQIKSPTSTDVIATEGGSEPESLVVLGFVDKNDMECLAENDSSTEGSTSARSNKLKLKGGRKLDLTKAITIRFENVTDEMVTEVQDAGFLLWEFRPMDNSFMEEWGKFEKFPRYKWEKPGNTLDKEVAVDTSYAQEVLSGLRRHKWSNAGAEDIIATRAMSVCEPNAS